MVKPDFSKPYKYKKDATGKVLTWASKGIFPRDTVLGIKPKPVYLYGKTETEVKKKIKAFVPQKATLDKTTVFSDYLTEVFIPSEERRTRVGEKPLQWTTYLNRKSRLTNYVTTPRKDWLKGTALAECCLGTMTPKTVKAYFDLLVDKGVSRELRHQLRLDLNLVFKQAEDFMAFSPRQLLKLVVVEPKVDVERAIFDLDEVRSIIFDEAKPLEYRLMVAFQMTAMCRPSEMWALTWADISEDFTAVKFDKALRLTKDGERVTPGTKNHVSGTVHLPDFVASMLREVRKRRMASEAVFVTDAGEPMTKDRFQARWPKIKAALGLTGPATFYSLKHLGNSWMAEQGIPAEVRAKRMRHKDERMAMRVYRVVKDQEAVRATTVFDTLTTP